MYDPILYEKYMQWAITRDIKGPSKPILTAIAFEACHLRPCCLSYKQLAFMSGFSQISVKRAVKYLKEEGFIKTKHCFDADNAQRANEYFLCMD